MPALVCCAIYTIPLASIQEASEGRAVLGIGRGGLGAGVRWARSRLREVTGQLPESLAGLPEGK